MDHNTADRPIETAVNVHFPLSIPLDKALPYAIGEIGSALSDISRLSQRGLIPGDADFKPARDCLLKAAAALMCEMYSPPIDPRHAKVGKPGN